MTLIADVYSKFFTNKQTMRKTAATAALAATAATAVILNKDNKENENKIEEFPQSLYTLATQNKGTITYNNSNIGNGPKAPIGIAKQKNRNQHPINSNSSITNLKQYNRRSNLLSDIEKLKQERINIEAEEDQLINELKTLKQEIAKKKKFNYILNEKILNNRNFRYLQNQPEKAKELVNHLLDVIKVESVKSKYIDYIPDTIKTEHSKHIDKLKIYGNEIHYIRNEEVPAGPWVGGMDGDFSKYETVEKDTIVGHTLNKKEIEDLIIDNELKKLSHIPDIYMSGDF